MASLSEAELREILADVRLALEPFAKAADVNDGDTLSRVVPDGHVIWTAMGSWSEPAPITIGDLRRAARTVETIRPGNPVPPPDDQTVCLRNTTWDDQLVMRDWRRYISDEIRRLWPTFNDEQRRAIHESADQRFHDDEYGQN